MTPESAGQTSLSLCYRPDSPRRLNYTELGEYYGVHRTTIKRDIDAVAEDVAMHLGHRVELNVVAVYHRVIDNLLEEDPREAWKTAKEFSEWLEDRGVLEGAPEKRYTGAAPRSAGKSESYTVLDDEEL